ncbi:hypothetical protein Q1695_005915 [Nippostrongylus brasiliensis]|nr:hypothetical protein Q1695_005915 [Nippostrongylus brasiliensis]
MSTFLNNTNLDTLSQPHAVRTLTIRCSHFSKKRSAPPPGIFRELKNLDRLEIDRCALTSLPGALLSGLHKLYSLVIKNARLPAFPDELFRHTPNLITLDITGNELRIEPYSVKSLRNLVQLDLSNNSIAFLTNTLVSLTNLNVLTMDNNKLTNIDFRRLPEQLTDLSLRNNFITTVHYVLHSARNLRRIDLSGNQLDFIAGSGSVNMLPPALKQVDLARNRISFIQEGALSQLENLTLLDLKDNQLNELKEESLKGPQTRLRLFLAGNPFQCDCSLYWLLHATEKSTAIVLDLPKMTCIQGLEGGQVLNMSMADQLNLLTCTYQTLCPLSCTCCEENACSCRSTCPPQCQCYRSVNIEQRNAQNILLCEQLRLDQFAEIPSSTTELRLSGATWKHWDIAKLQKLPRLNSLRISNSTITEEEANSLPSIPSLVRLQLSSTSLSRIPPELGRLTYLHLDDNPLLQLTAEDLKVLDGVRRVSLTGNSSGFMCDCGVPSPLQLWLREKRNREKVQDVDSITCYLPLFGAVPILSTLPGNESLCREESLETTKWIDFVTKVEQHSSDDPNKGASSDSVIADLHLGGGKEIPDLGAATSQDVVFYSDTVGTPTPPPSTTATKLPSHSTTARKSVMNPPTRSPFTTVRQRRKYAKENNPDQFLNALVFILFICIVVLIVTIAFTLYYRFIRPDRRKHHKRQAPEQAPLNGRQS